MTRQSMLVTGSSGLIGSTVCQHFHDRGWDVHGIDNNQRAVFFGPLGDTRAVQRKLVESLPRFRHHECDIRDRDGVANLVRTVTPAAIVHAAAQPSHDRAAAIPYDDFDTNAGGTLNMLEAARQHAPESPFVYLSTNKVYGDRPNQIAIREGENRWLIADPAFEHGVSESMSVDGCLHSLFGASKLAADIVAQEYGRYFGMPTCIIRGGCLTGPAHAGVELHGFLSYLVKCNLAGTTYNVFGYKGKQVRDNIHAADVAAFIDRFIAAPRNGVVYNIGGGFENSCSILEAFKIVSGLTGKDMKWTYCEEARKGDHICYYTDLRKIRADYPGWAPTISLSETISQIISELRSRL